MVNVSDTSHTGQHARSTAGAITHASELIYPANSHSLTLTPVRSMYMKTLHSFCLQGTTAKLIKLFGFSF